MNPTDALNNGFPGVPVENFSYIRTGALSKFHWSSTGKLKVHWSSWGCSWTWPSCATTRGMSRSPNSWMRQYLKSELDREFWLVADPSQCKATTWPEVTRGVYFSFCGGDHQRKNLLSGVICGRTNYACGR